MEETAKMILSQVPDAWNEETISKQYPVMYEQSMNTVLIQEVIRLVQALFCNKSVLNAINNHYVILYIVTTS